MNTESQSEFNQPLIKEDKQPQPIPYLALMRYASRSDKVLMIVGSLAALINGASTPIFALIFGRMTSSFSRGDPDEIMEAAGINSIYFLIAAAATFILSVIMFSTWLISGERQGIKLRKYYFGAILIQEVGWFDSINPNELNSKVADETYSVQGAIQEKAPTFIMTFSTFICGFLIGYITGWKLALVITACLPVLACSVILISAVVTKSIQVTTQSFATAAAESEQALNAVKTVKMLDGEDFECSKYTRLLTTAAALTVKYSLYQGLGMGLIFGSLLWAYALGFWYGAKLISEQTINSVTGEIYSIGDVMTVFFSILMGSFSLGQAGPCFQSFGKGAVAGGQIFTIIDRKPKIFSPMVPKRILNFTGEIVLENVEFTYPARPESKVLNRINLRIPPGLKVALVGESGCGKSTVLQLIERFYDCDDGQVLIGNERIDVKDVDLVEYRSQIGMVGQEPVLFAASIRENLLFGKTDATESEMIEALKKVNAWEFVEKMEKGLETYVGIGGSQLSGGQKQRIAIARAILKKPKVLLLDEATSALDRANEKLIQSTLDEVSKGITTIVIAHRLSTIQNADIIYVFEKGVIVEQGTHQELINKGGKYESLAKNQLLGGTDKQEQQQQITQQKQDINEVKQNIEISVQSLNQFAQEQNAVECVVQEAQQLKQLDVRPLIGDQPKTKQQAVMARLFSYNKEERIYFVFGLICSLINGAIFPIFSVFLSEMITVLVQSSRESYRTEEAWQANFANVGESADRLCLWFFLLGLGLLIFSGLETFLLQYVAEKLTLKIRVDTFRKLLRMPIPFFDMPENNAGTLTARLSVDCKIIQGLTSTIIGFKVQNLAALITGLSIAFSASWALTLIVFATAPISFIGRKLKTNLMGNNSVSSSEQAYKDSGNLIMEAVTNIRTVYSFGNEKILLDAYSKKVQKPLDNSQKSGILAGLAFGFANMQMFIVNALIFYMGAVLIKYDGLEIFDMFKAIFGITFATIGGAKNSHFAGDMDKGKEAALNVFAILDSTDEFQIETQTGSQRLTSRIDGNVEVKGITFQYPSREKKLFQDLSLSIKAGSKVAFVGPSGCGKSTIMQMLMRFYDPESGEILLDGINIKDYDIRYLRKQLAIVSQEPVLFNGTISENIRYNQQSTQQQIEEAAKQANAYDFIVQDKFEVVDQRNMDFGTGFSKLVGPKGSQISGGQKQRIAIARAILRNANILLLDEATSALDSQSEEIVQDSLNRFMQNKTSLSIAHRISTIRDSDIIYVFEDGKIVEQGDYKTLIGYKQFFYRLEQGITQ